MMEMDDRGGSPGRVPFIPPWLAKTYSIFTTLMTLLGAMKWLYLTSSFAAFVAWARSYLVALEGLTSGIVYGIGHAAALFSAMAHVMLGWLPIRLPQDKREALLFAISFGSTLFAFGSTGADVNPHGLRTTWPTAIVAGFALAVLAMVWLQHADHNMTMAGLAGFCAVAAFAFARSAYGVMYEEERHAQTGMEILGTVTGALFWAA